MHVQGCTHDVIASLHVGCINAIKNVCIQPWHSTRSHTEVATDCFTLARLQQFLLLWPHSGGFLSWMMDVTNSKPAYAVGVGHMAARLHNL